MTELPFQKNVGELEECITSMCARAFSVQKESDTIDIKLMMLPREILRGVKPELSRGVDSPQNIGAVGAAVTIAVGTGLIKDIGEAKKLIPAAKVFKPNHRFQSGRKAHQSSLTFL